jgi:hypothetical protein
MLALFSTHPPVAERVARLIAMQRTGISTAVGQSPSGQGSEGTAVDQKWGRTARTQGWRETSRRTARVAHGLGEFTDVEGHGSGRRLPSQSFSGLAPMLQHLSRLPLAIASALLGLLGIGAVAAYVVLSLFGIFAEASLGHAPPEFSGDRTASLRVLLIQSSVTLVALLEPLRALLHGSG